MNDHKKVLALLNDMGETADDVAAFLKEKGITGFVRTAKQCPVANYLVNRGAEPDSVVGANGLYYGRDHYRNAFVVQLPHGVRDFIAAFDNNQYQELAVPEPPRPLSIMFQHS